MPSASAHALPTLQCGALIAAALLVSSSCLAQGSATLGNGLSAAAIARGGNTVAAAGSALDSMEGNPAGLASVAAQTLDVSGVGLIVGGSFTNGVNQGAKPTGLGGAMPYGAYALPFRRSRWVVSTALTPEILMRANWHYVDAAGTAGVSYGYRQQETSILAVRPSVGVARSVGKRWAAGVTLGVVYNQNELHAPYIFQQQAQLAGLKVLLDLTTRGYGWNGSAGVQWQPASRLRAGVAWKSGTTIRTQGDASGSASALFQALSITVDPTYHYHAQVINHLPQAFAAGAALKLNARVRLSVQGDLTAWGQAFQQLPITLSGGSNAVINSVVGANSFSDAVPLNWSNQASVHAGVENPISERVTLRAGYSFATNPVPRSTLSPLTAAIMRNSIGAGGGVQHGRWRYDAAYQAQLPATENVVQSGLKAGEYNNSSVKVWTQSLTLSAHAKF